MPIKNTRAEVNIHADYHDVEQAINAFYCIENYELLVSEECSNGTALQISVSADPLTADWDLKKIAKIRAMQPVQYSLRTLLQNMCAAGDILPGKYIISVSW